MALTSSSTYADALAQYQDNAAWDGNVARARLALEAIRHLKVLRPKTGTLDGDAVTYEDLKDEEKVLQAFVAANASQQARFTRVRPV